MLSISEGTVLPLEHAVPAPVAAPNLDFLGARLIGVECTGTSDPARQHDESDDDFASYSVRFNRSKESVSVNVKSGEGRQL